MSRDWAPAVAIIIGATIIRLALAAAIPLVPDETYYWEWSRRLAGGYYDHPYAIALSVYGGVTLLEIVGQPLSPFAVRLVPVLQGAVAGLATVGIARRLGTAASGTSAAIVISVMPLAATGLVLATPDAPLLAAAAVAIYGVVRAIQSPLRSGKSLAWWMIAGLGTGAAMASKYTGILIPAAVVMACLVRPTLRERFTEPGPYVATALASLVLLPVLWWNAHHDWISFGFQLQHGFAGRARGTPVGRVLEMIGGQAGLVSPILFVLLASVTWRAVRRDRGDDRFILGLIATTCFAIFAISALRKPVEANWPALSYIPAIPLLASAALGDRATRWYRRGWLLALVLTSIVYAHALFWILPLPPRKDPIARGAGWSHLAHTVARTMDSTAAVGLSSDRVHLAAERYQDASQLAFNLPSHPRVFSLNLVGRANQYDLWPGFTGDAKAGDSMILVLDDGDPHPVVRLLDPHFATVSRGPVIDLRAPRGVVARRRVWVLDGWRGSWPERAARAP